MPLQSSEIQFQIAEKKVTRLSKTVRSAIEQLYGPDFKNIFDLVEDGQNATPLYYSLYADAFDKGLSKEKKYTSRQDGKEYVAEPVAMLKRSSALALVNDAIFRDKEYNGTQVRFLSLDIKRFARANLLDKSAGDYLANQAALALRRALTSTIQGLQLESADHHRFIDFRYGGDEFMVAVIGDLPYGFMEQLEETIKTEMEHTQCFYDGGKNNEIRLGIKLKKIESSGIPEDQNERSVFLTYLQRGIVLDTKIIKKIMKMFTDPEGAIDSKKFDQFLETSKVKDFEYPEGYESTDKKIEYLGKIHPEYTPALWLAQEKDSKAASPERLQEESARKRIIRFIEKSVYNPLFQRNVLTFDDLIDHIQNIEKFTFDDTFTAESVIRYFVTLVNSLKDINDGVNPAVGDQMLLELGNQISLRQIRKPEDQIQRSMDDLRNTKLSQRGGTIITQVSNARLTDDNYRRLSGIETVTFTSYDGTLFTFPIGICELRVKKQPEAGQEEQFASELLNKMIIEAEDVYYERFLTLLNRKQLFQRFLELSQKTPDEINAYFDQQEENGSEPKDQENVIYLRHFLYGKNAVARCTRALHALEKSDSIIEQKDEWKEALIQLKEKWTQFEATEFQKELAEET